MRGERGTRQEAEAEGRRSDREVGERRVQVGGPRGGGQRSRRKAVCNQGGGEGRVLKPQGGALSWWTGGR